VTRPLVTIGRVVKAHGIRGEVVVDPLSDVPGRFEAGAQVLLDGELTTIDGARQHQGRWLVRFEGVADRTQAERLRGASLEGEAADLDDEAHYYAHELVGMRVVDEDGGELGEVAALIELPPGAGYDLLEVDRGGGRGRWLLPLVDAYVVMEPDPNGGELIRLVDPPVGLVETASSPTDPETSP